MKRNWHHLANLETNTYSFSCFCFLAKKIDLDCQKKIDGSPAFFPIIFLRLDTELGAWELQIPLNQQCFQPTDSV